MQGGIITKYLDRQVSMILCHLYHQSRTLRNKSHAVKHRTPLLTFQNNFTNILNSILERQILWGPCSEIKQYLQDNIFGKNVILAIFMKIFHLDRHSAKRILSKYPVFNDISKKTVINNYQSLKNAGTTDSLIQDNILLLTQNNELLQQKIKIVQQFTNDINDGLSFLYHNIEKLSIFAKLNTITQGEDSIPNLINYFKTRFKMKPRELNSILSKYLLYITQDPKSTSQKLRLLLDNVCVNSLINDNWPMHCRYEDMKIRLKKFSESRLLPPPKPWILLCNNDTFNSQVESYKTAYIIKQSNPLPKIVDFLSERSGCNKVVINYKISTISQQKFQNVDEIKKLINIIIKEGYEYHDIIWSIKILSLKKDLVIKRFYELKTINHKAPFLDILLLPDKAFINYVNSHKPK